MLHQWHCCLLRHPVLWLLLLLLRMLLLHEQLRLIQRLLHLNKLLLRRWCLQQPAALPHSDACCTPLLLLLLPRNRR